MSIEACNQELDSINKWQMDNLHVPKPGEPIHSVFYRNHVKYTWHAVAKEKLAIGINGAQVTYTANNNYHFLISVRARETMPAVWVKPQYRSGDEQVRIAWCHNLANNRVVMAKCEENGTQFHSFDHIWLDQRSQYFLKVKPGARKHHNICIGNQPFLENWNQQLPAYTLSVKHPWFYSESTDMAFPLFYRGPTTKLAHQYTLRNKVTDLLRVQRRVNGGAWENVIAGAEQYLETSTGKFELPPPELWGKYGMMTPQELNSYVEKMGDRPYYYRDIAICDAKQNNTFVSGTNTPEVVLESKYPCLAAFWAAENVTASRNHNYSNYSTNVKNLRKGWSPIEAVKPTHAGGSKKYSADDDGWMPSDHFSLDEPEEHCESLAAEPGYNMLGFSAGMESKVGLVLGDLGSKIQFRLADTDIFRSIGTENVRSVITDASVSEVHPRTAASPEYMVRVRLLLSRKFTATKQKDGTYKFVLD